MVLEKNRISWIHKKTNNSVGNSTGKESLLKAIDNRIESIFVKHRQFLRNVIEGNRRKESAISL